MPAASCCKNSSTLPAMTASSPCKPSGENGQLEDMWAMEVLTNCARGTSRFLSMKDASMSHEPKKQANKSVRRSDATSLHRWRRPCIDLHASHIASARSCPSMTAPDNRSLQNLRTQVPICVLGPSQDEGGPRGFVPGSGTWRQPRAEGHKEEAWRGTFTGSSKASRFKHRRHV